MAAASEVERQRLHNGGRFVPRRLCARWTRDGRCWKADECTFAHGIHELDPKVQAAFALQPQPHMWAGYPGVSCGGGATLPWQGHHMCFPAPQPGMRRVVGYPLLSTPVPQSSQLSAAAVPPPAPVTTDSSSSFQLNVKAAPFKMPASIVSAVPSSTSRESKTPTDSTGFALPQQLLTPTKTASSSSKADDEQGEQGMVEENAVRETESVFDKDAVTHVSQHRPANNRPSTVAETAGSPDLPAFKKPAPARRLPGVVARPVPPPLNLAAAPDPLPSPAAAAALKFIRRNQALLPTTPSTLQSPVSAALTKMRASITAAELTPCASTFASEHGSSPHRSQRPSSSITSGCLEPGSPSVFSQTLQSPKPRVLSFSTTPCSSPMITPAHQPISRTALLQIGTFMKSTGDGQGESQRHIIACAPQRPGGWLSACVN
mmetsp:Transcript_4393/g.8799  ORF Transcript_4393/g.8799 Transcript_4393/m.8799 type:complete len:432 (-) Transcript_4393:96-1391(-)